MSRGLECPTLVGGDERGKNPFMFHDNTRFFLAFHFHWLCS